MSDLKFNIECDTTQLDTVIEKMARLLNMAERAKAQGVTLEAGTLATCAAVGLVQARTRLSRRQFFGLGFKR